MKFNNAEEKELFDRVRFLCQLFQFDIEGRINRGCPIWIAIVFSKAIVKRHADITVIPLLKK